MDFCIYIRKLSRIKLDRKNDFLMTISLISSTTMNEFPGRERKHYCCQSRWLNNLNQILNFVARRPLHNCQKIQQDDTRESIIG